MDLLPAPISSQCAMMGDGDDDISGEDNDDVYHENKA